MSDDACPVCGGLLELQELEAAQKLLDAVEEFETKAAEAAKTGEPFGMTFDGAYTHFKCIKCGFEIEHEPFGKGKP